mmetsp:Transcript_35582/g.84449  ORF Transcript_35582/g.84449 Transcript_35582/m.84449 type:complete len:218 (-) Transcript_35582:383-1036(-)
MPSLPVRLLAGLAAVLLGLAAVALEEPLDQVRNIFGWERLRYACDRPLLAPWAVAPHEHVVDRHADVAAEVDQLSQIRNARCVGDRVDEVLRLFRHRPRGVRGPVLDGERIPRPCRNVPDPWGKGHGFGVGVHSVAGVGGGHGEDEADAAVVSFLVSRQERRIQLGRHASAELGHGAEHRAGQRVGDERRDSVSVEVGVLHEHHALASRLVPRQREL